MVSRWSIADSGTWASDTRGGSPICSYGGVLITNHEPIFLSNHFPCSAENQHHCFNIWFSSNLAFIRLAQSSRDVEKLLFGPKRRAIKGKRLVSGSIICVTWKKGLGRVFLIARNKANHIYFTCKISNFWLHWCSCSSSKFGQTLSSIQTKIQAVFALFCLFLFSPLYFIALTRSPAPALAEFYEFWRHRGQS